MQHKLNVRDDAEAGSCLVGLDTVQVLEVLLQASQVILRRDRREHLNAHRHSFTLGRQSENINRPMIILWFLTVRNRVVDPHWFH